MKSLSVHLQETSWGSSKSGREKSKVQMSQYRLAICAKSQLELEGSALLVKSMKTKERSIKYLIDERFEDMMREFWYIVTFISVCRIVTGWLTTY